MSKILKYFLISFLGPNTVADKFGYEFHGNARNYLKIDKTGTNTITFSLQYPSTLVLWLYILNENEL